MRVFELSSPAFGANQKIPAKYTCHGAGTSPPLQVTDVPASTMSMALIVYDPDVPRSIKSDGRYFHWGLWNLSPTTALIKESRGGGINETGSGGYVAPCPPNGEHRYIFQLFALDTSIGDATIANEADLRHAMQGHIIEQAELVGRYGSWTSSLVLPVIVVVAMAGVLFMLVRAHRQA